MKQVNVAIIGRPSSGKSTFVNTIAENKVSIVSSVPQSTLAVVRGVYETANVRFVLFDTPGIYESGSDFNKVLRKQSLKAIRDCDCILYMIDGKDRIKTEEKTVAFYARTAKKPVVALINKCDLMNREDESRAKSFLTSALDESARAFVGSAKGDIGLDDVLRALAEHARESDGNGNAGTEDGAFKFTDSPLDVRVSEVMREAAFGCLAEEIPHAICVVCDEISQVKIGIVRISAVIYCEKESQKGIIIGKNGSMIRKITNRSVKGLKAIFPGLFVDASLRVKVKKDWKRDKAILAKLGIQLPR